MGRPDVVVFFVVDFVVVVFVVVASVVPWMALVGGKPVGLG